MRNRKPGRQEVMITTNMAPQAKLLVYYTRRDGEIVADAISFSIEDIFKNEVCCFYLERQSVYFQPIVSSIVDALTRLY